MLPAQCQSVGLSHGATLALITAVPVVAVTGSAMAAVKPADARPGRGTAPAAQLVELELEGSDGGGER